MILNRGGEPSGSEASGSGRNGFEAFNPSGHRVSIERSQLTCLVVEDDHTMRHLVMNYLAEHDIRAISASRGDFSNAAPFLFGCFLQRSLQMPVEFFRYLVDVGTVELSENAREAVVFEGNAAFGTLAQEHADRRVERRR